LIRSTALSHGPQLHALLATAQERLKNAPMLDEQRFAEALKACKSAYRWTVVDAPRLPATTVAEMVRHSDATFLVMQLTIKDMRVARQMLAGLAQHVPGAMVQLAVGRYCGRRQLIGLDEARQAMGLSETEPMTCLSNDYQTISKAVNFGKLLADVAKRSDMRRDVQKLAANLVQTCQTQEKPMRPTADVALV